MRKLRACCRDFTIAATMCCIGPAALAADAVNGSGTEAVSAADIAKIDALFAQYDKPSSPGCALGVMRNGRLAYAHGYGMADIERKVPITPASLFDIASTSKQFSAAAVVLLALDGKLSLSDDVRKYVPELPDYGAPITIDHLLHHTSGLRDYIGLLSLAGIAYDQISTDEQTLAILARQRQLNFPTGTRHEYSNTGYFLLSVIVQRVSGQPMAKFSRERIFEPLGMTSTRIRDDYAMLIPGRALGYAPAEDGTFKLAIVNWQQTGDGAVQLSIEDALKWDENFYQPKLGGAAFVERLQEPGKLTNGEPIGYARGLFIDTYRGLRRVQHGGSWIGYRSAFDRYPDQHTSIALFCNGDGSIQPRGISHQIADIVLAGAFREPPASAAGARKNANVKPLPRERFLGKYFVAGSDSVMQIVDAEGALALKVSGATLPLTPRGPATFALAGSPGTVDFPGARRAPAQTMRLQFDGMPAMVASRFVPAALSEKELQAYVGMFHSDELDVTWPIVLHEGKLAIRNETTRLVTSLQPLAPAMADAFNGETGFIRYTRDAAGRITGFDVSVFRMRGIRFEARP